PDFEKMQKAGKQAKVPIMVVLKEHPKDVLVVIGGRLAEVTWFYTVVTFALTYATGTLGIEKTVVLDAIIWGALLSFFTMPLFGILGDRIGHKWVFMAGTVGIALFSSYFFELLGMRAEGYITVAMVVAIGVVYAALYGPEGSLFSN